MKFEAFLKSYIIVFGFCSTTAVLSGFLFHDIPFMIVGIYLQIWVLIMLVLLKWKKEDKAYKQN